MEQSEYTVLRKGFDSLDVAFQGAIAASTRDALRCAKARATSNGMAEYVEINGIGGHVSETGARGGYAFVFNTGPDGEIWTIKDNPSPYEWNIRVSVANAQLVVNGYHETKAALYARLKAFGASVIDESISRVDFAVDFVAPGFELDPAKLSYHSHSTPIVRGDDQDGIPIGGSEFSVAYARRKPSSVTIGKMPGRQTIIYDKRREVARKAGTHWWEVWNAASDGEITKANCPPIWRVEVRAGKTHLKEWRITTFADLEQKVGDMFASACQAVRLMERDPQDGENVTRIPDHALWALLREEVESALVDHMSGAERKRVVEGRRDEIKAMYRAQLMGLATSYAVASGETPETARDEFSDFLANDWASFVLQDEGDFARRFQAAKNRLHFLDEGERPCLSKQTTKSSAGDARTGNSFH